YSMIGGAVAGAFLMINGTTSYTSGGLGVFGIFNYITPEGDASGMWFSVFGILIAAAIGFGLTMAFWKDDAVEEEIA
ncbi:PTS glucose transporter subunit IIA, partial [Escherichia coli]